MVGRSRNSSGVGIAAVLDPSDERFAWEYGFGPLGPVERFRPVIPAVDECAYKPLEGMGKNVGVAGREDGVDNELVVALLADKRDCGLRRPVFIVLWPKMLALFGPNGGDGIDEDGVERNAVGAGGLETRRRSFSL